MLWNLSIGTLGIQYQSHSGFQSQTIFRKSSHAGLILLPFSWFQGQKSYKILSPIGNIGSLNCYSYFIRCSQTPARSCAVYFNHRYYKPRSVVKCSLGFVDVIFQITFCWPWVISISDHQGWVLLSFTLRCMMFLLDIEVHFAVHLPVDL